MAHWRDVVWAITSRYFAKCAASWVCVLPHLFWCGITQFRKRIMSDCRQFLFTSVHVWVCACLCMWLREREWERVCTLVCIWLGAQNLAHKYIDKKSVLCDRNQMSRSGVSLVLRAPFYDSDMCADKHTHTDSKCRYLHRYMTRCGVRGKSLAMCNRLPHSDAKLKSCLMDKTI